jgi:putative transposase
LGLNRSSLYYKAAEESSLNLELMNRIDKQYTACPFYGIRRMTAYLRREGYEVNQKRIARLMRKMGIKAIYPEPKTSVANPEHRIYPYLLRGVLIQRVNQVWSCDITYVRLQGGFLYLMAVMDWHSRYVLSWRLSNTMEVGFCVEALESALLIASPEIFNSDQGSQFTSKVFTERLESNSIKISMDGRGRAFDNIFIERLWRSVKYEDVYLKDYKDGWEANQGLGNYFKFYNDERLHSSLGYRTPKEVYFGN